MASTLVKSTFNDGDHENHVQTWVNAQGAPHRLNDMPARIITNNEKTTYEYMVNGIVVKGSNQLTTVNHWAEFADFARCVRAPSREFFDGNRIWHPAAYRWIGTTDSDTPLCGPITDVGAPSSMVIG